MRLHNIRILPSLILLALSPGILNSMAASSASFLLDLSVAYDDIDQDGMRDSWEQLYGLIVGVNDADGDPDNDGKTNIQEYNSGSNPIVADANTWFGNSPYFSLNLLNKYSDTDGDGLPDWWELAYSGNMTNLNPFADIDGDGMTNLQEYNGGWNPLIAEIAARSVFASRKTKVDTGAYPLGFTADSDGDGMPDWWELKYGLNMLVNDGAGDLDGDGISNLVEYRLGMQPDRDDVIGVGWAISLAFLLDTIGLRADTDGDGMPDWWEIFYGLDPLTPDADQDPDGDGRTNIEEYNAGTNPFVDDWAGPSATPSLAHLLDTGAYPLGFTADSDGDGMPDWWEIKYGLNPFDGTDANEDPDFDAFTNLQEFQAGTNPNALDFVLISDAAGNIFVLNTGAKLLDTDGDGIPDWWERDYSGRATGISAQSVYDASGLTSLEKYIAGLQLYDASSQFVITDFRISDSPAPGSSVITWDSVPDRTYKVYVQTNLQQSWSDSFVYQVDGDGSPKSYTNQPTPGETRFIRISVELSNSP